MITSIRKDQAQLDLLLHEDFIEVEASGNIYNKQEVLRVLPYEENHQIFEIQSAITKPLSSNCFLLTYTLLKDNLVDSRRSSIWVLHSSDWQLFFHQGTSC